MTPTSTRLLLLCVTILSLVQGCAGAGVVEPTSGLVPTGGSGAELVIYAGVAAAMASAFALAGLADLLCLPFAAAGHLDYFFCCKGLIDLW
jgi:hypothetical protein